MFETTQILTFLITVCSTWGLSWYSFHKNKGKQKAETENLVVNMLTTALNEVRREREEDRKEIAENKKKIKEQEIENQTCEFEHEITRLQLNKVLKILDVQKWVKSTVYVLDDNDTVIKIFSQRFRTIQVVYFKAFTNADECLKQAMIDQPEILVLDYVLSDDGRTAEDIIKSLGYEPEIFIMSANKEYEEKFRGTDVKFFYKDQYYVRKITKAILEHLVYRNS